MSSQKSIEVNVTDPGGKVIGKISTTGMSSPPPSAGVAATVTKNAVGKTTGVHGTVAGNVVVDLPDSGQ